VPRELLAIRNNDGSIPVPIVSDQRVIDFWLAGSGDTALGLARQEIRVSTSDDVSLGPPIGTGDEANFVKAPEVKSLRFIYFDGTQELDSWDGTQLGEDGVTPIGPPQAIIIEIGVIPPDMVNKPFDSAQVKVYRHVVFIPTANGTTPPSTDTTTTPATTGAMGAAPAAGGMTTPAQ
jgi:hypothetical protein